MMDATGINAWGDLQVIEALRTELAAARTRIAELEAAFGEGFMAPAAFCLTPMEERLLGLMMSRPRVSKEQAITVLYGDSQHKPARPDYTVLRFVWNLRAKLKLHKIIVNNVYGYGWAIPVVDKERILEMIKTDPFRNVSGKRGRAQ
jgi:DNA-binding response OmpR family regulator